MRSAFGEDKPLSTNIGGFRQKFGSYADQRESPLLTVAVRREMRDTEGNPRSKVF
jgi:hypothetical protein